MGALTDGRRSLRGLAPRVAAPRPGSIDINGIAIRVDNLSKLYPARSLAVWRPGAGWAGHLGAVHQRPDTLRDALTGLFRRGHQSTTTQSTNRADLQALRDVSFEACPPWTQTCAGLRECNRRIKRGEVVGTPALASGASVIGHNGAGKSTLLKILSRITEPTSGRAVTCGGGISVSHTVVVGV